MGGYLLGYILVLVALVISLFAQAKVNSAYNKYSRLDSYTGVTGALLARRMLDHNGLHHVQIREVGGRLSDYYDPRNQTVNLSQEVYEGSSIASLAVACHECGHAIQHSEGYTSLVIRNMMVPYFNVSQTIGYVVIMIGLMINSYNLAMIGIVLIGGILVYQLLTLPIEFNASARALDYFDSLHMNTTTYMGAKDMLQAAAFTYVAAAISALATVLRFFLIVSGNRRRR